jgi:hypothetical protein
LRFEVELFYGRLISFFTVYNFTSKISTETRKYKPADGVTLSVGYEHYTGIEGSLYDIIDDFMKAAYFSIRVDF